MILLILVGLVLLLPGLCSLAFLALMLRDPNIPGMFVLIWLITFAIAAGGIVLIRHAVRGRSP
jgi:hypothetical protein